MSDQELVEEMPGGELPEDEAKVFERRRRAPYPYYPYYPPYYPGYYPVPGVYARRYPRIYPGLIVRPGEFEEITFLLDKLIKGEKNEKAKAMLQELKAKISKIVGGTYPYPTPYPYPKVEIKAEDEELFIETEIYPTPLAVGPGDFQEMFFLLDKLIKGAENEQEKGMLQQIKAKLSRMVGGTYPYPTPYPYPRVRGEDVPIEKIELDEEGLQTIEILRVGSWQHEEKGTIEISEETLNRMVENFKNNVLRQEIPVDVGHKFKEGAAGWIKSLFVEDGVLKGQIEWTPKGRELIENKIYKYISAEFDFDYKDAETGQRFGPTLIAATLTIRPFVKDLAPVAMQDVYYNSLVLLSEEADMEKWEKDMQDFEAEMAEVIKNSSKKDQIMELVQGLLRKWRRRRKKALKAEEDKQEVSEVAEMKTRLEALEKELKMEKLKNKVNSVCFSESNSEGKIPSRLKGELMELYLSLGEKESEKLDRFIEKLPSGRILLEEIGCSSDKEITPSEEIDMKAKALMKANPDLTYREALKMVTDEKPILFEEHRNSFRRLSLDEQNLM